jgi:hypothetical protein
MVRSQLTPSSCVCCGLGLLLLEGVLLSQLWWQQQLALYSHRCSAEAFRLCLLWAGAAAVHRAVRAVAAAVSVLDAAHVTSYSSCRDNCLLS